MALFEFNDEEIAEAYWDHYFKLNGREPCFVGDADQWTENYTGRPIPNKVAEDLCAGCHVLEECAAYALLNPDEVGIWGGMTADERKRIRDA